MEEQLGKSVDKVSGKLTGWLDMLILNLPNIILALVIFVVAYYGSQKLSDLFERMLRSKIKQHSIRGLIGNIVSIVTICFGIFLSLSVLNLDKALSSILAGAGVAGLAVGLALQGTIANTFSGIFLAVKDILNVNDFVETNGYRGVVQSINLRYVTLKESDNNLVIIPNNLVVEQPFKNFGLTTQIRTTIECGVGYDSDLKAVRKLAIDTISKEFPQGDKEVEFHYLEFGDSSINFQIRFWVDAKKNKAQLEAKSQAIILIKEAFDNQGIDIPFPIRTLITKKSTESSVED